MRATRRCVLSACAFELLLSAFLALSLEIQAPSEGLASLRVEPKKVSLRKSKGSFEKDCLSAHNKWRRTHNATSLKLDPKVSLEGCSCCQSMIPKLTGESPFVLAERVRQEESGVDSEIGRVRVQTPERPGIRRESGLALEKYERLSQACEDVVRRAAPVLIRAARVQP